MSADDALDEANRIARGALTWVVVAWDGARLRLAGGNSPDAAWGGR